MNHNLDYQRCSLVRLVVNSETETHEMNTKIGLMRRWTYMTFVLFTNLEASSFQKILNWAVDAAFGSVVLPMTDPDVGCIDGSLKETGISNGAMEVINEV